jgi:hypothetical protein
MEGPTTDTTLEPENSFSGGPELQGSIRERSPNRALSSNSPSRFVNSRCPLVLPLPLTNRRKHEANRRNIYTCEMPQCQNPHFSNKGGLDRHNREKHGSDAYFCPHTSCNRHIRGFQRKNNLYEHQKRCHPVTSPKAAIEQNTRQCKKIVNGLTATQSFRDSGLSSNLTIADIRRRKEKLERLESLYNQRTAIDAEIEVLKEDLN